MSDAQLCLSLLLLPQRSSGERTEYSCLFVASISPPLCTYIGPYICKRSSMLEQPEARVDVELVSELYGKDG